ncbi:MAG TPA: Maf family protein, partial [Chloroflexota bacterium]|nr:Maf family protein [Chloroflexota bacterium]
MTQPPPGWPVRIVLASGSPQRIKLLQPLGVHLEVRPADIDEAPLPGETPPVYADRLAKAKAMAIADSDDIVVAADTVVDLDGRIMGQPADRHDALTILSQLSGRSHLVHTGLAVRTGSTLSSIVATTEVTFTEVSDTFLAWYIDTGEPFGKAGAYAIQ